MNGVMLVDKIRDRGLKLGFVAERIGITRSCLSLKIGGKTEFRLSEVSKLAELLDLCDGEIISIFFTSRVD